MPLEYSRAAAHEQLRLFATRVTLAAAVLSSPVFAQQATPVTPKATDQPLTVEQLSVYKPILVRELRDSIAKLNLVEETQVFSKPDATDEQACLNSLDLEQYDSSVVHTIRPEDLAQLKLKGLRLVEQSAQEKEVEKNDPSKAIRSGSSVDSAVKNGFAHGYFWLSEIRFDKSHTHAAVSYGFRCGGLCGHGGTVLLEKTDTGWSIKKMCSIWMS